jgi:UDP-N-acetylmuramoylalanine--D-glutamate ligase
MKTKEIDSDEILVVELSSFQIENLNGKYFQAAVVINITPDHLIWHGSYENYIKAKLMVKDAVKSKNNFFISKQIKEEFLSFLEGDFIVFDEKDPFSDIEGMEGDENIAAAYALCKKFNIDKKAFIESFRKFKKPAHRIELVAQLKDISFYNDSKSTNIYSTIYAVKNLKGPIILIAGGEEKKLDFRPWIDEFKSKVKYIYLIGRCAKRIKEELSMFDSEIVYTMDKAVEQAYKMAKKGDKILLSPGCSSYDQFRNFEHRGEEFRCLVRSIEKGGK